MLYHVKIFLEMGLTELKDKLISSNYQNHRSIAIFICTQKLI